MFTPLLKHSPRNNEAPSGQMQMLDIQTEPPVHVVSGVHNWPGADFEILSRVLKTVVNFKTF